ncbi:MAG: PEP-CTERM sorting domain-containing protein, partial [Planctomycetota bacterium]
TTAGVWEKTTRSWNSGTSNVAVISLINPSMAFTGNDFALDDISFAAAAPEPASLSLAGVVVAALCWRRRRKA